MKFGKSIRAEARNNRSLSFINFKYLKRILKKCGAAVRARSFDVAKEEDQQFCSVLESELRKVGESHGKELRQISHIQDSITQQFPMLDVQPDPETYIPMGFEQLQAHLQSLGGLGELPLSSDCAVRSSIKTSAALCEFCINLGKISARCKRLRRCVLWNAVAVVKILKKREKHRVSFATHFDEWESRLETAAQVLARQDWYCCNQLPKIVSIVETTTDALMLRLTSKPPNRDRYQCPICLDVVVDPVSLKTCGHRFCWACLCMAFCEKPEGTLERCPCCRSAFPLHPEAFEVDGILSRFLRDFFPEDQSARAKEQKENLRQHLATVQRQQEYGTKRFLDDEIMEDVNQCCPDCVKTNDPKLQTNKENQSMILMDTEWINEQQKKHCQHELNVKLGIPADVDRLAFTTQELNETTLDTMTLLTNSDDDCSPLLNDLSSSSVASSVSYQSNQTTDPSIIDSVIASLLSDTPTNDKIVYDSMDSIIRFSIPDVDSHGKFLYHNDEDHSNLFHDGSTSSSSKKHFFIRSSPDGLPSVTYESAVHDWSLFDGGCQQYDDHNHSVCELLSYERLDDDDDKIDEDYFMSVY